MTPDDLQRFHQAVSLTQAGQKTAAYATLVQLSQAYPNEPNLALWLAFTSPNLNESRAMLDKVARLEPTNPALGSARQWLTQTEASQPPVTPPPAKQRVSTTFTPDRLPVIPPAHQPKLGYQYQQQPQQRIAYRQEQPGFFDRFSLGWQFMKQAARMARNDTNLLKPSFYSIGLNLLVSLVLAIPLFLLYISIKNDLVIYATLFVSLLVNYFITYFFSALTIHLVHQHLTIGTSEWSLAWAVARRSTGSILAVAAVSAFIGTLRRGLSENQRSIFGFIGSLLVRLIESVWTTATFFILPAIVIEDREMGDAVKRATFIIKNNLLQIGVGYLGLSIICGLLSLGFMVGGFGLGALAFFSLIKINLLLAMLLALAIVVVMLAISSALNSYLRIAYYTCLFSWAAAVERNGIYAPPPTPLRLALQSRAYAI